MSTAAVHKDLRVVFSCVFLSIVHVVTKSNMVGRNEIDVQDKLSVVNLPRIKLIIIPTTNDVRTDRPLNQRYDML